MDQDRISIFNQLTTDEESADFNELLDLHYFKFNYFYELIRKVKKKSIQYMKCTMSDYSLEIDITVSENINVSELADKMLNNKKLFRLQDEFSVESSVSGNVITLNISSVNSVHERMMIFASNAF